MASKAIPKANHPGGKRPPLPQDGNQRHRAGAARSGIREYDSSAYQITLIRKNGHFRPPLNVPGARDITRTHVHRPECKP